MLSFLAFIYIRSQYRKPLFNHLAAQFESVVRSPVFWIIKLEKDCLDETLGGSERFSCHRPFATVEWSSDESRHLRLKLRSTGAAERILS